MRKECIQAVSQKLGRELKKGEAEDIEQRIMQARSRLAYENTDAYRQMTEAQQITAAAEMASKQILHDVSKKHQRQTLNILANQRVVQAFEQSTEKGSKTLLRLMRKTEQMRQGIERFYFRDGILKTIEAIPAKFAGMMHDMESVRAFVREVYGESSGMAHIKEVAGAWVKTAEDMRERLNNAGGDVGKLDYAYLPQNHNQLKIHKAGKEAWTNKIMPLLDRNRYMNADGSRMSVDEMKAMLSDVYETITTGGLNKMEPGKHRGNGGIANRHSQSRALHFKNADAHLDYAEEFGRGNIMQAMQSHVAGMSRDIALMEDWGAGANANYRMIADMAEMRDGKAKLVGFAVSNENVWNYLTRGNGHPANVQFAEIAQGIRNIQSAAKLGSAMLSSFTDTATLFANALYNKVPALQMLTDLPAAMGSSEYRHYADRIGLMSDTIMSEINRWTEGNLGDGWTAKAADLTFRVSLLNAWTDGLKRAFAVNMTAAIGKMSRTEWGALHETDRIRLQRAGIDEATFSVWQKAQPEIWRNQTMLTADSIMAIGDEVSHAEKLRASAALLGYIQGETDTAITSIDMLHGARMSRAQKGEVIGEIALSFMQFKSFPASLLSRQLDRISDIKAVYGNTAAAVYAPTLIVALTGLGAMSLQAKALATGKDPQSMDQKKFWMQAFIQGGGLGIYGDILNTGLGGNSRGGQPNWVNFAGPTFGTALDLMDVSLGNIGKAASDKETNVASGLVRVAKQNIPLNNLWYTRAAVDHLIWNNILEQVNPGYLARVRRNTRNNTGQDFWWNPEDAAPDRAPDFAKAMGQ